MRRIMYEIAAICYPEMPKKNSSIPRVVSTITIDISGNLKVLSTSQIMFTCFHKILSWHLPFKNVICNIVVAINFYTFELVIVFIMVSNDVIIM